MRPGDFSPGNSTKRRSCPIWRRCCFNEAGGFLPRKRRRMQVVGIVLGASMRPGDFSPGNRGVGSAGRDRHQAASMRPGDFSPGNRHQRDRHDRHGRPEASMRPGDFSPGNTKRRMSTNWSFA